MFQSCWDVFLLKCYIKSVKKVRSAIKLCSYSFSYNVLNDINVT